MIRTLNTNLSIQSYNCLKKFKLQNFKTIYLNHTVLLHFKIIQIKNILFFFTKHCFFKNRYVKTHQ